MNYEDIKWTPKRIDNAVRITELERELYKLKRPDPEVSLEDLCSRLNHLRNSTDPLPSQERRLYTLIMTLLRYINDDTATDRVRLILEDMEIVF